MCGICGISAALIFKSRKENKPVPPLAWLLLLFGGMTILFCVLYCIAACVLVYRFAPRTFRIRA